MFWILFYTATVNNETIYYYCCLANSRESANCEFVSARSRTVCHFIVNCSKM